MKSNVAVPVMAGIAGLIAMMALAFMLSTQTRQGSDLSLTIPQQPQPVNQTIVGNAPNTTGLLSQGEVIVIAIREIGLIEETERIERTYAGWFYVNQTGQVYGVNPQTGEMTSSIDYGSRSVGKLANFESGHYWVIALQTGLDSGYVLIIDASTGNVKDESGYEF